MFKNFFQINDSLLMPLFKVITYGYQECDPLHSFGPAIREYFLIHFVYEGKGIFKNREGTFNLGPGDLFLIHPDELTYYCADKENPWKYQWVGFTGSNVHNILSGMSFSKQSPVITVKDITKIKSMFDCLNSVSPSDELSNLGTHGALSLILYNLLSETNMGKIPHKISAGSHINKILSYFEQNYPYQISINSLSIEIGLERTSLYRIFKKETGLSPKEYLIKFRIGKACELLSKTNLGISQVAESVGMCDSAHFATMFKNLVGKTPRDYRSSCQ